ncbi:stage V sporulation protein AB [Paenibacillus thermoaerophilus]|uniref:Stage V sporulation protein AB n=1 Tax=Paenibacillus thermoaerophilus TaxID=1215385 RepID=A0ABW2V5A8_9BACL|nr:stage V sporulation protein AB [Paenibacillus thermoaerophilus]
MKDAAETLLLIVLGLSGGLAVGGGMVSLLVVLDLIPRVMQLSGLTGRYKAVHLFEGAIVAGVLYWTAADFNGWALPLSPVFALPTGLLQGVFIGMLAAALTEVLNVLPIMAKRLNLAQGIGWLLMAMVFGKVAGSLFDWLIYRN